MRGGTASGGRLDLAPQKLRQIADLLQLRNLVEVDGDVVAILDQHDHPDQVQRVESQLLQKQRLRSDLCIRDFAETSWIRPTTTWKRSLDASTTFADFIIDRLNSIREPASVACMVQNATPSATEVNGAGTAQKRDEEQDEAGRRDSASRRFSKIPRLFGVEKFSLFGNLVKRDSCRRRHSANIRIFPEESTLAR